MFFLVGQNTLNLLLRVILRRLPTGKIATFAPQIRLFCALTLPLGCVWLRSLLNELSTKTPASFENTYCFARLEGIVEVEISR
jgi:hypothetical protein